ncbi:MAG TPA: hypothetical protein VNA66_13015, partial [Gammaproteobacteria bacterium]|nr:hypothetical protein [Gammaproteobacteria bacterium]
MVVVVVALAGAVVGGVLLGDFGGAVFGLVVGAVAGSVADLTARVRTLERKLEASRVLEARVAAETAAPPPTHERETPAERPPPEREVAPAPPRPVVRPGAAETARGTRRTALQNFEPSIVEKLFASAWTWLTTGNVPVKVGVVLSLFGVGFLVKE